MKKGKRVFGVMIVGIFLVLSISLVSAGIRDWFGFGEDSELEGELPTSFDTTVNLQNAPPEIVAFRDSRGFQADGTASGTGDGQVLSVGNEFVFAEITFIVQDPNHDPSAPDELPGTGGTSDTLSIGAAGNIEVDVTSPQAGYMCTTGGGCRVRSAVDGLTGGTDFPNGLGLSYSCEATTCAGGVNDNCPCTHDSNPGCSAISGDAVGTNNELQVQYTCYVRMNYWDEPDAGVLANEIWTITARIEDKQGRDDAVSSGITGHGVGNYNFNELLCTGIGDCDYVHYGASKFVEAMSSLNWQVPGVDVDGTDQGADDPDLAITNRGNEAVSSADITAQDLKGVNDFNLIMDATAFTASSETSVGPPPEECDATSGNTETLISGSAVEVLNVNLPFTAGAISDDGSDDTDNIYFCIAKQLTSDTCGAGTDPCLTGGIDTSYKASTDVNYLNQWAVTYS